MDAHEVVEGLVWPVRLWSRPQVLTRPSPVPGRPGMYGKRIRYHYSGNTAGSTLRLNLGCLLAERLGIQLRRVGSGQRLTFAAGEARLSAWMADNALSPGSRLIASGWRNSG